jgi:hypothetical protein
MFGSHAFRRVIDGTGAGSLVVSATRDDREKEGLRPCGR